MTDSLLGIHEIAVIANVSPSAVANWRKRSLDFPPPLVELKSGPVFAETAVRAWLAQRDRGATPDQPSFYDRLATSRGDDSVLIEKVNETARLLDQRKTSTRRPGMLLGKIQSGKTRAYIGIIAKCFDLGYDIAIVLTKGTKSLAFQTVSRISSDFKDFIRADKVQVFDIMALPDEVTLYELDQKLVFVVKKEDDNLDRLLYAFEEKYPQLQKRRILIIDDEADLASVSFRKIKGGSVEAGTISKQIDQLLDITHDSDLLQVTATPYSLYLQPEEEVELRGSALCKPRKPEFTVVLPTHEKYVGGNYYFEKSDDQGSPAYFFYKDVSVEEREALKKEDRRRLKIENVLGESRAGVLVEAIMTLLVGGAIRRIQQERSGGGLGKYSFLFHTERKKDAHAWQERVVRKIRDRLVEEAEQDTPRFRELLQRSYGDLERSVKRAEMQMPRFEEVKSSVTTALLDGHVMITLVNSDKDIEALLDSETGQLRLRTPFNIFIGGQILDRGITINNLIGFYYGRNPKKFQQDTVLQHSRMYGARSIADLAVTRLYAPRHVYEVMRKINELDSALREAFESGAHDQGVYFLQRDAQNRVLPCSPNKLMLSNVETIRPGRRLLPTGFQTVARTRGLRTLRLLDDRIDSIDSGSEPVKLIDAEDAGELLQLAYENLEFEEPGDNPNLAHRAALDHLSKTCKSKELAGKVWLIVARDRNVKRYREEGRFSDAPDTKQQSDLARSRARCVPVLMLLRQNGERDLGWRGLPFWWPVIVTPTQTPPSVFSREDGRLG